MKIKIFDSEESDNSLEEGLKYFAFRAGKKKEKFVCPPGQKVDPTTKKCKPYGAAQQMKAGLVQRKAAKKRKVKIRMTLKKRAKTLRIRTKMGFQGKKQAASSMLAKKRAYNAAKSQSR